MFIVRIIIERTIYNIYIRMQAHTPERDIIDIISNAIIYYV